MHYKTRYYPPPLVTYCNSLWCFDPVASCCDTIKLVQNSFQDNVKYFLRKNIFDICLWCVSGRKRKQVAWGEGHWLWYKFGKLGKTSVAGWVWAIPLWRQNILLEVLTLQNLLFKMFKHLKKFIKPDWCCSFVIISYCCIRTIENNNLLYFFAQIKTHTLNTNVNQ